MRNAITRTFLGVVALVGALSLAGSAIAGDLYVDGQRVDFLEPANLEHCTIVTDAEGNVHITTPSNGVAVPVTDADGPRIRTATLVQPE